MVRRQINDRKKKKKNEENDSVKVVYISNPLKVTLTVSEFKERVQQLTGQDSDIGEYMLLKKEEHEMEEEEEEGKEMSSTEITNIELSSIPTQSNTTGASLDLAKNDFFPFVPFYDTTFTDLCYNDSSKLLDNW